MCVSVFSYESVCPRQIKIIIIIIIIIWSLSSAGIPASKKPTGLTRLDDKRPDGLTLALGKMID